MQKQMTRLTLTGLLAALTLSLVFCASKSKPPTPKGDIPDRMQQLSTTLSDLYPYVVDEATFNTPENQFNIDEKAGQLAQLATGLDKNKKKIAMYDKDPSLSFISKTFAREIQTAVEALKTGKRDYARYVLKNSTAYCIQCHTRGQWGPELSHLANKPGLKNLGNMAKAEIFAAARNYDEALKVYRSVLDDTATLKERPERWEEAAKQALNVSIRTKQDPKLAKEIARKINKTVTMKNRALLANSRIWLQSVNQWKLESGRGSIQDKMKITRARNLIKEARERETYSGKGSGLVEFLRASALLHDYIRSNPGVEKETQATYLLGQAYEHAALGAFSNVNEFYYKACIHRIPHSKIAQKCFDSYEASLLGDFSHGGGLMVPPSAVDFMDYLRNLAKPK